MIIWPKNFTLSPSAVGYIVLSSVALVRTEPVEVAVIGKFPGVTKEAARKFNASFGASLLAFEEFHSPKARSYDPEFISVYFFALGAPGAPEV